MSVGFQPGDSPRPPKFTLDTNPPERISAEKESHQRDLQSYVNGRLAEAESDRRLRLRRYASIDRSISTWQKLKQEDVERQLLEEATGRQQGLPVNLPLLATHLEDTVAFFTDIYAPESRSFFQVPEGLESDATVKTLVERMNRDTAYQGYGLQIARAVRSMLKYNAGGFAIDWAEASDVSVAMNQYRSIDMYNCAWDPVIQSLPCIAQEAEWTAEYSVTTRRDLVRKQATGEYDSQAVDQILFDSKTRSFMQSTSGDSDWGLRYVRPPTHIGLTIDGQDSAGVGSQAGNAVNWASYGLDGSAGSQSGFLPTGGFEKTVVNIWLDPSEFGLASRDTKTYELWKLVFINGKLVKADSLLDQAEIEEDEAMPIFFGYYTDDDLGEAQRSVMELMRGFQRFASYLMNVWILGARKSIYGLTYYDPDMFDPNTVHEGQVAGYVALKRTGRDIRTGIYKDEGRTGVENTIEMLGRTVELVQNFFPSQAAPAQIAGMDRAVKSQVTSFLTSAKARLRLAARTMDTGLFMPVRKQAFRNLSRNNAEGLTGLTEEQVMQVLGSGLKTLESERVEMILEKLLALISGSEALISRLDIGGMFTTLSRAMNAPFDLGTFVLPQQPQAGIPGQPPAPGQAPPPAAPVPPGV